MKELIIKVDDPGERVWDGSPKTFEIQELVRCKDCKYWTTGDLGEFCPYHHDAKPNWFCADGEAKE